MEGAHDGSNNMTGMMMIIHNEEEPNDDEPKNVHKTNSKGDSTDGTCTMKEDGQEDLSQFELMDKIDVT